MSPNAFAVLQPDLGLGLEVERRFELANRVAADDREAGRGQVDLIDVEQKFAKHARDWW